MSNHELPLLFTVIIIARISKPSIGNRYFLFSKTSRPALRTHPDNYSMDIEDPFPLGKDAAAGS
jgi:hypothetical protein